MSMNAYEEMLAGYMNADPDADSDPTKFEYR